MVRRLVYLIHRSTQLAQHVDLHVLIPRNDRRGISIIRGPRFRAGRTPPHGSGMRTVDVVFEALYALQGASANQGTRLPRIGWAG